MAGRPKLIINPSQMLINASQRLELGVVYDYHGRTLVGIEVLNVSLFTTL